MIEIKKSESKVGESLFFNEIELKQVQIHNYVWGRERQNRYYFIKISGFENASILSEEALKEFPPLLTLKFINWLELVDFYVSLEIDTVASTYYKSNKFINEKNCFLSLRLIPYLENWNFVYSFNDYKVEFEKQWKMTIDQGIYEVEDSLKEEIDEIDWIKKSVAKQFNKISEIQLNLNSIEIEPSLKKTILTNFSNETIFEIVSPFLKTFINCHNETLKFFDPLEVKNSYSLLFNFPEDIKNFCEQYLVYFATFLRDLGISATSDLKQEAGKVLFSVTPTDETQALDRIREALAVYLNLPTSPIVYDESFAAMRLKQQIDSLKHSQQMAESEFRLRMAQSLLEAQNKTIEDQSEIIVQQSIFIQQQKEHLEKIKNPSVMMDSVQNKEELEELYDGLKIGESKFLKEQLGIHLNPAKVIKTVVKNTFGKDTKISIVDSDEESDK